MNWLLSIGMGLLMGALSLWLNSPKQVAKCPTAEEFNRRLWTPEEEW